jgi:hypothetical protein
LTHKYGYETFFKEKQGDAQSCAQTFSAKQRSE